jgi:hypothetical protein
MRTTITRRHAERGQERRAIRRFTEMERRNASDVVAATIIAVEHIHEAPIEQFLEALGFHREEDNS